MGRSVSKSACRKVVVGGLATLSKVSFSAPDSCREPRGSTLKSMLKRVKIYAISMATGGHPRVGMRGTHRSKAGCVKLHRRITVGER